MTKLILKFVKVKYIIFIKNSKIIVHRTKKCSEREREIESDARGTEIRTSSWFFDIWLRYGDIDRQKLNSSFQIQNLFARILSDRTVFGRSKAQIPYIEAQSVCFLVFSLMIFNMR